MPFVLNSNPFTETVLPAVSELNPEKSSKFMFESVTTLIMGTGGVASVNRGEEGISTNVPIVGLPVPTVPVICEGHKRTKSVVIVVIPPVVEAVPGRI